MASQMPDNRPSAPPPAAGGGIVGRIQRLILSPAQEWDRIDAEPMTEQGILTGWVAPLAAIGPVAGLIGNQVFGYRLGPVVLHPSLGGAIVSAVVSWLITVAAVYVLALVIDALAPTFGAAKNRLAALKVAGFGATAGFLAGVFGLIPAIAFLSILGLYSLYLIWLGLPKLMKVPADKAIGYFAATIVTAVVLFLVIGAIAAQLTPAPAMPSIEIRG